VARQGGAVAGFRFEILASAVLFFDDGSNAVVHGWKVILGRVGRYGHETAKGRA
jgi:hypothetical protein